MRRIPAAAILVLLAAALLGAAACGGQEATTTAPTGQVTTTGGPTTTPTTTGGPTTTSTATGATTTGAPTQTFSLEQLAQFDGKEGRQAYVAVDGVVYDVTASAKWAEGTHASCNLGAMAGQDLSELITKAPANMRSLLEKMPVVGALE